MGLESFSTETTQRMRFPAVLFEALIGTLGACNRLRRWHMFC